MGSFSFSLFPVIRKVCAPWYCQIPFPDLNVGIVGIRIWVAICPSARLPQSARSYRQGDNSAADRDPPKNYTSTGGTTFSNLYQINQWSMRFPKLEARGVNFYGELRKLTFSEGPLK